MNKRKEKRNIPPEVRKYIRQVAEFLPKETTGIKGVRALLGSGLKEFKNTSGKKLNMHKHYVIKEGFDIPVNHEKKLIDIYLKDGWSGLKEYCDKALAKVNIKPKYNDDTIKD